MESADFDAEPAVLPEHFSEGIYEGRKYGVSLRRCDHRRREADFLNRPAYQRCSRVSSLFWMT
jgi:hypothetical protein